MRCAQFALGQLALNERVPLTFIYNLFWVAIKTPRGNLALLAGFFARFALSRSIEAINCHAVQVKMVFWNFIKFFYVKLK